MLSKIEPLLSLSYSAQELCISFTIQSSACFIQEDNRCFDVSVLATNQDGDDGVLDRIQLAGQSLDHMFVQLQQVLVIA